MITLNETYAARRLLEEADVPEQYIEENGVVFDATCHAYLWRLPDNSWLVQLVDHDVEAKLCDGTEGTKDEEATRVIEQFVDEVQDRR